jgi:hypothetical protein
MYKALPLLQGLKELRLGATDRTKDMELVVGAFGDTLEVFSSRTCWNSDVETLAKNCRQLKCLDISGSTYITDRIVDFVLLFEHLEELNLYETNYLTNIGLLRILTGLVEIKISSFEHFKKPIGVCASRRKHLPTVGGASPAASLYCPEFRSKLLKRFGCDRPSETHLRLIAEFSNLTSLALTHVLICPLTPLKDLKHLQKLTLKKSRFSLAEEFLKAIGNQLKCLHFIEVSGMDLNFISEKCPSLLCLHLCFDIWQYLCLPYQSGLPEAALRPAPVFPTVTFLQLSISDRGSTEYILTGFRNLKKLSIGYTFDDETFLQSIIQNKYMIHLEELFWGDDVIVKISGSSAYVSQFYIGGMTSAENVQTEKYFVLEKCRNIQS